MSPFRNRTPRNLWAWGVSTTTPKYKYLWPGRGKACQWHWGCAERQKSANILHPRTRGFSFYSLLPSQLGAILLFFNNSDSKHTETEFFHRFCPSCSSKHRSPAQQQPGFMCLSFIFYKSNITACQMFALAIPMPQIPFLYQYLKWEKALKEWAQIAASKVLLGFQLSIASAKNGD